MSFSKEELSYLAIVAEQAERFEDMYFFVKSFFLLQNENDDEISIELFNLFSLASKICIYNRQKTLKTLYILKDKPGCVSAKNLPLIQSEISKKQSELSDFCTEITEIFDKKLIAYSKSNENRVLYMKMKADKCKSIAEYLLEPRKSQINDLAKVTYEKSFELACKELATTNRIRLILVLSYSVFCYEVLADNAFAIKLAKKAYDDAISQINLGENENDENQKEILLILQLLRDNFRLWEEEL